MRVHHLDEHFGVTKEEIYEALEAIGHSTNAVSGVSDEALAALEERFGSELQGDTMPAGDRFEVVDCRGAFRETACLDPALANLVRAALKPHQKICDYTLNLDRGEFVFVTYPDAQKVRIPYGR